MMRVIRIVFVLFSIFLLSFGMASCSQKTAPTPMPRFDVWLATPTPDLTIHQVLPTLLPTAAIKKVFYITEGAGDNDQEIQDLVRELSENKGFHWEAISQLEEKMLDSEVAIIIGFRADTIIPYISQKPAIKFLYIGNEQIPDSPNLIKVPYQSIEPEKMDFLAGYIAAMISDNWRVGIISNGKEITEKAFDNGFRFFCGLCRPVYPPFVQYPVIVQTNGESLTAVASMLQENGVKTVYLREEEANNIDLIKALAEKGMNFISTKEPPPEVKNYWIVALHHLELSDVIKKNFDYWLTAENEKGVIELYPFLNVNESLFSLGKQKLAEKCYRELLLGTIDAVGYY